MSELTNTAENLSAQSNGTSLVEITIKVENAETLISLFPEGAALSNAQASTFIKMNGGPYDLTTKVEGSEVLCWVPDNESLPEGYSLVVDSVVPVSPTTENVITRQPGGRYSTYDDQGTLYVRILPSPPEGDIVKYNCVILLTDAEQKTRMYSWDPGIEVSGEDD